MFLNKTHIHEHVPGLISWNVGHEGKKGKAQCNLPGGAGYRSKERVTEIVTATESLLKMVRFSCGLLATPGKLLGKGKTPAKPSKVLQIAVANGSGVPCSGQSASSVV